MIDRNHPLPITRQAEVLGISRGAVYNVPRPISAVELALMCRIDELHLERTFMGMRERMNIRSLAPQPGTCLSCPGHTIYPYRLRHTAITRTNQVWALDTTYIPMTKGFVYLTAVIDVASRRVLAHETATTNEACHADTVSIFQGVPEALHRRVVIAVSSATHRLSVAVVLQVHAQFSCGVKTALVGVKDEPFLLSGSTPLGDPGTKLCHRQCILD